MTRKKVKFGALPTENMPKKSHETRKPPSRPAREIVKEVPSTVTNRKYYKGLTDVSKRIKGLKTISEWKVEERSDRVVLRRMKDCFQLPEFELIIDDSLGYTISVYGWFLPEDHELYTRSLRSMNNVTVSDLIRDIECQLIFPGVCPKELTGDVIPHVIPILWIPCTVTMRVVSICSLRNSSGGLLIVVYSAAQNQSSALFVWNTHMLVT